MQIKLLCMDDLMARVSSPGYLHQARIPISRHRAWSQALNPCLQPEDVVMLVAEIDGQMAGYLGLVPDEWVMGGASHRLAWMSCIEVGPAWQGQGIAKKLLATAMEAWQHHIIATEFTQPALDLYLRSGFFTLIAPNDGIRCYHRMDLSTILPPKKRFWAKMEPGLRLVDRLSNAVWDSWKSMKPINAPSAVEWEIIPHLDQECADWLERFGHPSPARRSIDSWNWMLLHPWVIQSPIGDTGSTKYGFTSTAHRFNYLVLKLYTPDGTMQGLLVVMIHNGHMKTPLVAVSSALEFAASHLIVYLAYSANTKCITTFQPSLTRQLPKFAGQFLTQRKQSRRYVVATPLWEKLGKPDRLWLHDGDGDAGFT